MLIAIYAIVGSVIAICWALLVMGTKYMIDDLTRLGYDVENLKWYEISEMWRKDVYGKK